MPTNVREIGCAELPESCEHWGALDSAGHSVQFYEDDSVFLDGVSRCIGAVLSAGNVGLVIATPAHRALIAERLQSLGFDLPLASAEGRYVSLDAAEILSQLPRDGWPDPTRFVDVLGGIIAQAMAAVQSERPAVAIFGEMASLLWAEEKAEAALRLEALWNVLAQTHSFNLLCFYPLSLFPGSGDRERFEKLCVEHARVIPTESYTSQTNEEDRLRAIVLLQQQARALAAEIAERTRAQQSLRQCEAELAKAIAARDEFLSVAAHELKTPITSLRAYAQLLLREAARQRETVPERFEFALKTIELQTGKLNHLIVRLLDRAEIDDGKLRIQPVRTDLVGLIRLVLAQQPVLPNHPIVFSSPDQLEARVDPVRFEGVITNLLDNAIKFSPGGGEVTIELSQDRVGDISLSVTDHGLGIPPDQHEAVVHRFQPAQSTRHLIGLGLGLYIAREIVELHGGTIRIEQPAHRGSRFVVRLPASA